MAGFVHRSMVVALVALVFSVGGAERSHAQAALLGPGAAYIGIGVSGLATGELDDRLAARGYPTFGGTAGVLGVGAYRILSSKVMLGFEGQGLVVGEEAHQGNEVGLSGGYATLGVGYAIELSRRVRVYPRFGFGAGGFALEIESEEEPVDFDDVLEDPTPAPYVREPLLSRDGMVVDVGGAIEWLPAGRGSGLLIGLRLGYLVAPWNSTWDFYQRDASGGPDASISGPYMRVMVGGAWRR